MEVFFDEAKDFMKKNDIDMFIEASAKTGLNTKKVFLFLIVLLNFIDFN